jgi:dTMP kinase
VKAVPRGRFISIEGIEGAGKSTQLDLVQGLLEQVGQQVVRTREPGGTSLGEEIRALLLGHRDGGMGEDTELLLMFAARAEHLRLCIRPALAAGRWVLSDRFTDASYAYQGGGRGLDPARIRVMETLVQDGLVPDLTLLLDLPVEVGLARAGRRGTLDRFEQETRDFFARVRRSYLDIAAASPQRIRVIDAAQDLPAVQAQIRALVQDYLHGQEP